MSSKGMGDWGLGVTTRVAPGLGETQISLQAQAGWFDCRRMILRPFLGSAVGQQPCVGWSRGGGQRAGAASVLQEAMRVQILWALGCQNDGLNYPDQGKRGKLFVLLWSLRCLAASVTLSASSSKSPFHQS